MPILCMCERVLSGGTGMVIHHSGLRGVDRKNKSGKVKRGGVHKGPRTLNVAIISNSG